MAAITYPATYIQVTSVITSLPILAQQGTNTSTNPVLAIPPAPNPNPSVFL